MSEFEARCARKAQLIQNFRVSWMKRGDDVVDIRFNMEDLLELIAIVAGETIEDYDKNGFFDKNCDSCGGVDE